MTVDPRLLFWLGLSFVLGFSGALWVAVYGYRLGLLDTPNARSSHRIPVPKGGGLGILIAFVVTALGWGLPSSLWIPAVFLALASFWGDLRDVSFQIRLAVQFGCAVVFSSFRFLGNPMPEISEPLRWGAVLFGALIIAATANCFNFMDGINGLAGLTGAIAFSCLGLFGMVEGKETIWSISAFGISAACLGFLPLNMPRARVFMGDVGSILLGFLFASWGLWFARSLHEFVVLFLFLFPFYLDELDTTIARIREKERLNKAHRRHIYQILANQAGISHVIVTAIYGTAQVAVILLGWLTVKKSLLIQISLLIFLTGFSLFACRSIRRRWEATV